MARFSVKPVKPNPGKAQNAERFAAQLALARVHPCLISLERTPGGYAIPRDETRGWFELRGRRGLAGYGLGRALRILLDVLGGLSALEDTRTEKGQPFVHGELVPAMVRIDPTGTARLIPLAPWHWSAPGTLPIPERHGHLAPERLLGDVIDARADVFSAGALLWEALAGRRLFETDSVDAIVMRLMGQKIELPELPPELSWAAPLKAVAMCALSADPEQRFANCRELADAITAVAGDRVATREDVAAYLRAPETAARSSVIAGPPRLPIHHSSLSALVAPLQPSEPAAPSSAMPTRHDSPLPERRVSRSVWAIAAISCMVGAAGASAVARYSAMLRVRDRHSAASSAVVVGTPLASVLLAPSAASPTPALVEATPGSAASAPAPVGAAPGSAASASRHAKSSDNSVKSHKLGNGVKAATAKPRAPLKAPRVPDKAAAKYGI